MAGVDVVVDEMTGDRKEGKKRKPRDINLYAMKETY